MTTTNACKISYNTIEGKLHLEGFPSYESWTSEYDSILTLSTSNTETIRLLSEGNQREEPCKMEVYQMGACKEHYDLYWTQAINNEHQKCPIDDQKIDFSFSHLKNGMFGVLFRVDTITGNFYTFLYTDFEVGGEFNLSPAGSNYSSQIISAAIKRVEQDKKISIIARELPLTFQYSDGILYFEEHRKTPIGNIQVKMRKLSFPKEEMLKLLTKLLNEVAS